MENNKKEDSSLDLFNRVGRMISTKRMVLCGYFVFVVLMLPICYLSFVNRASGDDYGYGTLTRIAWKNSHSLAAILKAAWQTVQKYYESWQGTWFSVFVFSLQPEVFSEKLYVTVAFSMLFLWVGSTVYLFRQIFVRNLNMDKWNYRLITILFLILNIQFIPSTKSSIYWFNGTVHYMLPFAMCQILVGVLLKYMIEYKKRYFTGILVIMTLLGGSNYQAALFALIVTCYIGAYYFLQKKDRHVFLLGIPVLLELAGLIISMKAPGNRVRGGVEFGFSITHALHTIVLSFKQGIERLGEYLTEKPLIFVGLLLIFFLFLEAFKEGKEIIQFKRPILMVLALFCLYSAMYAPEIYAGVGVSGGVFNMNFQVFLLTACGILIILADRLSIRIKTPSEKIHACFVLPTVALAIIFMVVFRGSIKSSTSFVCLQYITSGQALDYKEQMDLQTSLLLLEDREEVCLPFINDEQGPLMHMPVTDNAEAWSNTVVRDFYGKASVVGMPREEWNERYGNQ